MVKMITEDNYKELVGDYKVSVSIGYGSETLDFTIVKEDIIGLTKEHALIVIDGAADEAINEIIETSYWKED